MDNRIITLFSFLACVVMGFAICWVFFKPNYIENIEIVEDIQIDTVYLEYRDTIFIPQDSLIFEYIRDTVILDITYPINRYRGLEATLFGDIGYNALVAGSLLNLELTPNWSIPQIENTITRTETRTIIQKPKGLYLEGGISSQFNYKIGATYLNDRSLFGYEYQPDLNVHWVKTGFKIW
ncbi:hypothetical protein [Pleomorphovibrio marinus]|uniref:hypothetical protein n=1 Tax=Pleomorphovibrio marinus TaxID=2164132 RepID=UPI000E0B1668|nr:hypothetical protein [Pleomorphovibrio marinus]